MPLRQVVLSHISELQKFCATILGLEGNKHMNFQELLDELAGQLATIETREPNSKS